MKGRILTLALLGAALGAARAQCPVTVTKSGTGMTRTNAASSPASGMAYTWTPIIGGGTTTTGATMTRTYTYGGTYLYMLVGTKTNPSCTDSTWTADTVLGPMDCSVVSPTVTASGSSSTRSFYTSAYSSLVPNNYSVATTYSYGDGTSGTSTTHTYTANGTYTVTATLVYTSTGYPSCTKTATTTVTIGGITGNGCGTTISKSGTGMTRTYTAIHPNYSTGSWNSSWNTWPGSFSTVTGNSVTRTFTYGGTYQTWLGSSLTSPVVCHDSAAVWDTIAGPIDCAGAYLSLSNSGSASTKTFYPYASANVPPGYALSYSYNYGDGSTGTSATHAYASPGTYTATVTATWSAAGTTFASCVKTATSTVNIAQPPSTICSSASASITASGSGATYTFTTTSLPTTLPSNVGRSTSVSYGDGYYGTSGTSTHTYIQNGAFLATVSVTYYMTTSPYQTLCTKTDSVMVTVTGVPNKFQVRALLDSNANLDSNAQVKFWLIKYDSSSQMLTAVDSITTTAGWTWWRQATFNNVPNGSYRLKAHLLNQPATATTGYLPTYYLSSLNWNTATVVNCNNCGMSNYTWFLQQGTPVAGPGFVGGSVLAGANKGTAAGDPVADQLVLLRDANGVAVRSAYTNVAGQYSFKDVPAGTYTVYPEAMNYVTTASDVLTITGFQNSATGYNFRKSESAHTITPYRSTAGVGNTASAQGIRIHPNPTTGLVTVQVPAAGSDVSVRVVTVTGQEVHAQKVAAAAAAQGWNMDLSHLPAGYYNVLLETAAGVQAEMLLLQR